MRTLVDCTPLSVGGGVQVAVGVLAGLQRAASTTWIAAVPNQMKDALPERLAADPRIRFLDKRSNIERVRIACQLSGMERTFRPDAVFTVFGPQLFRSKAPHLVGFAQPHMIYDPAPGSEGAGVLNRIVNQVRGALFRRADFIVVETETARSRFADRVGFDPERIAVIPNAPNLLLDRLADLHQPDPVCVILMPSAWYPHKNLQLAPKVARVLRDLAPGLAFRFHLTLPPGGAGWRSIAKSAEDLGVSDVVRTLGALPVTELPKAYRDASLVYLPTVREVSTAVYPESFFFHRPLVTTDVDFARELCGDAAVFTPAGDARAAAEKILELSTSAPLRAQMVAAGAARLAAAYPTPEQKFEMQLTLLKKIALIGRHGKLR